MSSLIEKNYDSSLADAYFKYAEVNDNDIACGADPGTLKIERVNSLDDNGNVYLPEMINGMDVSFYDASCFYKPIKRLFIPKTIVAIYGILSFPNIEEELIVDEDNPIWSTDGVSLLSKDGTTLFRMCNKNLKAYTIPDGVIKINKNAFSSCTLEELTIPDSVTTIISEAFAGCFALETINGGKGITEYSTSSFSDTPWYKNSKILSIGTTLMRCELDEKVINIPEGIEVIGEKAISTIAEEIVLPSTIKIIGNYAFSRAGSLKKIELPEGLIKIGEGAFCGCLLREISIPKSVKEIGNKAFGNCQSLEHVHMTNTVSGNASRYNAGSTMSNGTLSGELFSGCSSLEEISIPTGTLAIGIAAFERCFKLNKINIPDSVSTIGNDAFFTLPEFGEYCAAKKPF